MVFVHFFCDASNVACDGRMPHEELHSRSFDGCAAFRVLTRCAMHAIILITVYSTAGAEEFVLSSLYSEVRRERVSE